MTAILAELIAELDVLLKPDEFRDYCPNGLQVEGKAEVGKLISGVTACQDLIDAAIQRRADAILVHHGYFWNGENPAITGIKQQRIRKLLQHDISLLAYHLPLDAHPLLGNNAQLGKLLGFSMECDLEPRFKSKVGVRGNVLEPCTGEELAQRIGNKLGRQPFHVPGRAEHIRTIGWCTGSAQSNIELAHQCGVDAYLTGEVSEQTVHYARESGIHFYAAGHHATERYGVQAVAAYLQEKFGLQHEFVDIDNPV